MEKLNKKLSQIDLKKYEWMVSKSWTDYVESIKKTGQHTDISDIGLETEYYCRVCCIFLSQYLTDINNKGKLDDNERLVISVSNSTKHGQIKQKNKPNKYAGMNFSHLQENVIFRRGFLGTWPKFVFNKVAYPSNENNDLTQAMFEVYKKHFSEKIN